MRTKRRQQAEERAGKVGVKLVFPLVLCLLPSLYAVCLGPAVVRIIQPSAVSKQKACLLQRRNRVDTTTLVLLAVTGVLVVLHVLRRRSRLNRLE